MSFLTSLAQRNRPLANNDLTQMSEAKRIQLGLSSLDPAPQIEAWDREYYYSKAMSLFSPSTPSMHHLSEFFSVGTCMAGLSSLFHHIYGIRFEPEKVVSNETWAGQGDVVKLAVIDEQEGKIGEIYCDLFTRDAKPAGAAHYTVRCSRRLDDDEADLDMKYLDTDGAEGPDFRHTLPLNPQPVKYKGRDGLYQMPVVVLTCDFDKPTLSKPGLLMWQEVETLFHEMGHAMHCELLLELYLQFTQR
jgi:intermediate peptidase